MLILLLACLSAPPDDPVAALRAKPIVTTRHGACRMACRAFDEAEVAALLATGRHVPERTRLDGDCPSHALEGTTADGQRARAVFADCPGEARLVTVIDLNDDAPCACD